MAEINKDMLTRHDEIIKEHTKTLDKHEEDISEMKEFKGSTESATQSLGKSIDNMSATIKWGVGLLIPTFFTLLGILIALWKK